MYKFILPGSVHYIPGNYVLYHPLKGTVGTVWSLLKQGINSHDTLSAISNFYEFPAFFCTGCILHFLSLQISKRNVMSTEYTRSGNCRFLAYITSWWKNQSWLMRVEGARTPTPFHFSYHHVHSCSVLSSWEDRYTPPISSLPLYVLCGHVPLLWAV